MKGKQLFNSFWLSSTTAVLATQPAWADTVKVTAVRLQPTVSGIEVILKTPKNASLPVFTSSYGETFVADIIDTQLHLPKGDTFRVSNPTDGITAVTVMPLNAKSIRVTVTGKAGVPVGTVVQSHKSLVFSLKATSGTSLTQAQSSPAKSHRMQTTSTKYHQLSASPTPTSTGSPQLPNSDILTQPPPAPSYLNPSPNPLQFPTRPEEVRIQGTQPITLQQAFELARRNNRTLQVAELTLERSRAALREAQAALYPTLNAQAQFTNSGNAFINQPASSSGSSGGGSLPQGATPAVNTIGGTSAGGSTTGGTTAAAANTTGGTTAAGGINTTGGTTAAAANTTGTTTTGTATTGTTTTGTTTTGTTTAAGVITTGSSPLSSTQSSTTGGGATAGGAAAGGTSPANTTAAGGTSAGGNTAGGNTAVGTSTGNGTGATNLQYGRFDSTSLSGTLALSYNLYTSGGRSASIRAAEEQVRFDQLGVEIAAQQLRLDVATDYYNLQGADQQVRIYQSAVTNAAASLRDAQAQERAGVGTRFDTLRAQVQLANQLQNLTQSQAQQQTARRQVAQRLSIAQSVDVSAADPVQIAGLWNLSLENSIVLAFKNRAELDQYLTTRNISEQNRRLALSALGPQVSLGAQYTINDLLYSLSNQPNFYNLSGGNDQYTVGVTVKLLLFDGGAARASAAQQEANKRIAETNFANERNLVRYDVENFFASLQANLASIQTSTVALAEARESLRLARLRFQAGVGTQTDVISAENDLTTAEGNRVNAILNYNKSLASLQRSVSSGQPR